ncbi:PqqD family peptide modification chaperone [Nocardia blacklockiae]|uniref:PqqD family peptide modification chaperone n=1 Tax=Nocardia blacklockiae TaxID=480036 RepID=UPI002B4B1B1F|nr:PqqD family peptide modification chaperone [Nocardia blacklockiae]
MILDERSGKYWQLNATGAHMLAELLNGVPAAEVARAVAARQPVAVDVVRADIDRLLGELAAAGLVARR